MAAAIPTLAWPLGQTSPEGEFKGSLSGEHAAAFYLVLSIIQMIVFSHKEEQGGREKGGSSFFNMVKKRRFPGFLIKAIVGKGRT